MTIRPIRLRHVLPVLLFLVAFLLAPARLQAQAADTANASAPAAADLYGRGTPRGLATGLINALSAQDYDRASQYLDLSRIARSRRAAAGPEAARWTHWMRC